MTPGDWASTDWNQIREFATALGGAVGSAIGSAVGSVFVILVTNVRLRKIIENVVTNKVDPVAQRVQLIEQGDAQSVQLKITWLEKEIARLRSEEKNNA